MEEKIVKEKKRNGKRGRGRRKYLQRSKSEEIMRKHFGQFRYTKMAQSSHDHLSPPKLKIDHK